MWLVEYFFDENSNILIVNEYDIFFYNKSIWNFFNDREWVFNIFLDVVKFDIIMGKFKIIYDNFIVIEWYVIC